MIDKERGLKDLQRKTEIKLCLEGHWVGERGYALKRRVSEKLGDVLRAQPGNVPMLDNREQVIAALLGFAEENKEEFWMFVSSF